MPYYITFHLFMCQSNSAPVASTETRNEKARASYEARAFFLGQNDQSAALEWISA
jgi:hypothetical protein